MRFDHQDSLIHGASRVTTEVVSSAFLPRYFGVDPVSAW